jgi:predicted DNA-binding transcriptional regulator YafY
MVIDYLYLAASPSDIKSTKMPLAKNAFERYKIIDRHLRRNKGLTARELTEIVNNELYQFERASNPDNSLEVSERMIRLDIKKMPEIFPVEIINRSGKFYYESSEDSIDNINITEQDKTAITLAMGVFSRFNGTPIYDKFSDAVTRILASSVLRRINTSDTKKYIQVAEVTEGSGIEWLEKIYNAIVDKKTLRLHYRSFGDRTSVRTISPYMLKEYRNKWYMIAYASEIKHDNKTILFKLSRIENIEDSDEDYYIDSTFNQDQYFKYSLGVFHMHDSKPIDVKLKFTGSVVNLISEDKLHSSMEIISKSDKEMIVQLRVYDSPELQTLILSFVDSVEVIEPLSLRSVIKERINKAILKYE